MKIGLLTVLFHANLSLEETLDYVSSLGIQAVELGGGGYPGDKHLQELGGVKKLIEDENARGKLLEMISNRGLTISAIAAHGNPIHPDKEIAERDHNTFRNAVILAELLGVTTVTGFSGCPGSSPNDVNPNWVTCAWPPEYPKILEYQWNQVAIPYWKEQHNFLKEHNVKFAIEMHPGFLVYNPETMMRLREATGDNIGCNLDPSHLWWQGIEPIAAVRYLKDAIYHVHMKDTFIDEFNSRLNGNLDTKSFKNITNRSWIFRSVGYGHSVEWWKNFVSNLRLVGYDYVLSIEHEDGMMSTKEGLMKALEVVKSAIMKECPSSAMYWA
jgi:sugar phosphate isomerase/epimerase